jgi:prefoldin alpha subunit
MAQLDLVQRQAEATERRMEAIEQMVREAQQAAGTLRSLAQATGEQEVLLPLGAGVHIKAKVNPKDLAIVPVGSGYATEGDLDTAAKALEARVEEAAQAFQTTLQDMERLTQTAAALNERLAQLSGQGT